MAVTLSIDITDTEQAKLEEIVLLLLPGKTPAEVKTILENHAKKLLYGDIKNRVRSYRYDQYLNEELVICDQEDIILPEAEDAFEPAP